MKAISLDNLKRFYNKCKEFFASKEELDDVENGVADAIQSINGEGVTVNKADVVLEQGLATDKVMSLKAVSNSINKTIDENSDVTITLSELTILDLGTRSSFTIQLPPSYSRNYEYEFMFVADGDANITFPTGIKVGDFNPQDGKEYDCIIYNNKLYYYEW